MAGDDFTIPQFDNLRRVPQRYRETFSLSLMKLCQCVVVGSARGVLTVALSDQQDIAILNIISEFTGRTIFPVFVSPIKIRLLIRRIEYDKRNKGQIFKQRTSLNPLSIHAMVMSVLYMEQTQPGHD